MENLSLGAVCRPESRASRSSSEPARWRYRRHRSWQAHHRRAEERPAMVRAPPLRRDVHRGRSLHGRPGRAGRSFISAPVRVAARGSASPPTGCCTR
ncbi:hypothetical protein HBB16_15715 [Pseudonocardia sp. MCCB 268]|nr:hypothetical protein [Pseudonocardia cytotoxica]